MGVRGFFSSLGDFDMAKRFIRSVLAQDEAVTVSTVVTYDLPVNPLSHIILSLKAANDTGTIANYSVWTALLSSIAKVEVLYKGQAIFSGSLADLMMLQWFLRGAQPYAGNIVKTNDDVRWITVVLGFGRRLFDTLQCFPATRKGELQLQITYAAAQTGIDTLIAQYETVELLDAVPASFFKSTTLSKTPTATGWHDLDLPVGNDLLGALLFSTTVPTGASFNASVGQVKMLLDNVEFGYSFCNWECLHGEMLQARPHIFMNEHIHRGNFTTTVEGDTGPQQEDDTKVQLYSWLEYDPDGTGEYAIRTSGHSRCNLRINQEPAADAIRCLPVELMRVVGAV